MTNKCMSCGKETENPFFCSECRSHSLNTMLEVIGRGFGWITEREERVREVKSEMDEHEKRVVGYMCLFTAIMLVLALASLGAIVLYDIAHDLYTTELH